MVDEPMRRRPSPAPFALALALTLGSAVAHADVAADKARADELFKAGRALAKDAKWSVACPKFEESQRLDPAPGTLLNLGVCHARTGKNALAYAELAESLSIAQRAKRADRVTIAHDELTLLEPKIARVTMNAPTEPNVTVTVDGRTIAPMALGVAQVVEPGTHTLRAVAPGKKAWEQSIAVTAGERRAVDVPALEKADDAVATTAASTSTDAPTSTTATTTTATTATTASVPPVDAAPGARDDRGGRRTAAFVTGGLGVAALGAGAFFAVHASGLQHDADDLGAQGNAPDAAAKADSARSAVTLARVGLGLGLIGVGVGTYLLVTSRSDDAASASASASVRVAPVVGVGFAGLAVGGGW